MSDPAGTSARWWRRSRDQALATLRSAQAEAGDAWLELDSLERDLPTLVASHQHAGVSLSRPGRPDVRSSSLVTEWGALSQRTGAASGRYLELDATYLREKDYEEPDALALTQQFREIGQRLRALVPEVQSFRDRHESVLADAYNLTLAAPRAVAEATSEVRAARQALEIANGQGLTAPVLEQALIASSQQADQAQRLVTERRWAEAMTTARVAVQTARDTAARAALLPQQAADVRSGFTSVRTRREGLQTQHDRLAPVMSDLRRRYTYGSWKQIEDAPARIDAALGVVTDGLATLEQALHQRPFDVPAAVSLLRQVRAAASDVDAIMKSAKEVLTRLDQVSQDPESVLVGVRRKALDARRFLANLPPGRADRYAYTFDNLAARTERLAAEAKQPRPDWGAVLQEADSIENGLDAMIRTARSEN